MPRPPKTSSIITRRRLDRLTEGLGLLIEKRELAEEDLRSAKKLLTTLRDELSEAGYGDPDPILRSVKRCEPADTRPTAGETAMRLIWRVLWSWRSPKLTAVPPNATRYFTQHRGDVRERSPGAATRQARPPSRRRRASPRRRSWPS